jgi:hypothetical protein
MALKFWTILCSISADYGKIRRKDNLVKEILLTASHEPLYLGENNQGLLTVIRKPVPAAELLDEVAFALNQNRRDVGFPCMKIYPSF